jgi:hypothetical protein
MSDAGLLCPIFSTTCIQERCISYKVYTKEAFHDTKLNKFIPIDDLSFYRTLTQEQIDERFNRIVSITKECKMLGTIISKEDLIDHLVPNPTKDYYS